MKSVRIRLIRFLVAGAVEFVEAHARVGRVKLEVEGGGLGGLLLLAAQPGVRP
ncbi:MAG: hypothetical protein IPM07_12575 [Anaerolineales bacterium]|nr:hypothetical protein [Anaerolineales bacterium]